LSSSRRGQLPLLFWPPPAKREKGVMMGRGVEIRGMAGLGVVKAVVVIKGVHS
jgi:hypothetical protein